MGCNCKNKIALEDKYGTPIEEGVTEKALNFILKVFVFMIVVGIAVIVTPIVFIVAIYKVFFGKDKGIMVPQWLLNTVKRL